jgi:hypothetical protein
MCTTKLYIQSVCKVPGSSDPVSTLRYNYIILCDTGNWAPLMDNVLIFYAKCLYVVIIIICSDVLRFYGLYTEWAKINTGISNINYSLL